MRVECLIKRESATEFYLEKVRYIFMPNPFGKPGQFVTGICDIQKEEHLAYLLKRPQFREYDAQRTMRETAEASLSDKNSLAGFSIEKFNEGYIVVDKRKRKYRYCGNDIEWRDAKTGIPVFASEIAAYEWLIEEVNAGAFSDQEPDKEEKK
jgi:hypothetical protein